MVVRGSSQPFADLDIGFFPTEETEPSKPPQAPPEWFFRVLGPPLAWFIPRVNFLLAKDALVADLNSWWRSIEHNLVVEGDPDSQHLWGLAADIQTHGIQATQRLLDRARRETQIQAFAISATAVHVQVYPAGLLRTVGWIPERLIPQPFHLL